MKCEITKSTIHVLYLISVSLSFWQKSQACIRMDQAQLPVYKLAEKYFINTMVVQLKSYVMIQLSYLTRAAKVGIHLHTKKSIKLFDIFSDESFAVTGSFMELNEYF